MTESRDCIPRFSSLTLAFSLAMGFGTAGLGTALAETRSVIDPVEAPEPQRPPAPKAKDPPQPDETVKRERRRADEQQRRRAEARALAAENEAAKLRAMEEARRAEAAAREAATRAAARKAAAARVAAARAAATKMAKAKAAEAAKKESLRQAAARDAAARKVAAREAIERETRETAAREAAARELAAREAAAREVAAREAAVREAAAREAREAAVREAAAREAAAKEAAARELAARELAAREAAAREAAAREAAVREAAAREAAAREVAAREATAREAAAKEAAAREAVVWRAKLAAGHETADSRMANGTPYLKVFRDCAECPEVVWLPRGELPPGQTTAASGPRYALKMSYVLAVGRFKVSNAEWEACVADRGCRRRPDGAGWRRARDPVTNVSWEDAQQYAAWLSRRTGKPYRLLTGPEWEYAARTGSEVYDMHGGVSEWVENCYQYRDPRNGNGGWTLECTNQTLRGGAQRDAAYRTGVSRSFAPFNHYDDRIGFRVGRTE